MFALIIAAVAVSAAAQPAPASGAILVSRRRLESWRGSAHAKKGAYECRTTHSSGDAILDQLACDSMTGCMKQLQPKVDALLSRGSKNERDRGLAAVNAELAQCSRVSRENGLRRLDAAKAEKPE